MTMKLSEDIVKILNESEKIDTKRSISKILAEIKRYQEKIKTYIDANYVRFLPNLSTSEMYLEEGETLIKEVKYLLQNIENETNTALREASDDLQQYIEDLQEVTIGLRVSMKILKIDDLFQCLEEAKSNKEYLTVMDIIGQLKNLIDEPSDRVFIRSECHHTIDVKYRIESEAMLKNLKQCFEQLVQFSDKPFQNTKSITIKISKDEKMLEDTVMALFNARYNPRTLCDFLMDNCFEPIVTKPVSMQFNDETSTEFVQLSLSYSLKNLGESLRPNYKSVFKNIEMLVLCLGNINFALSDTHVFTILGDQMKQRLLTTIVNECLMYSIPETMDEMQNSTLVNDVIEFHRFLTDSQLINEESDRNLLEFTDKIGIFFRNRFCSNIIHSALDIMRRDLHDMTLIAEKNTTEDVANNPFKFPGCMVSKSTLDLINLMEKILRQSVNVDDDISDELVATIPSIINLYLNEVPKHHEKLLHNIPQQSALFHNNCMFLAHWVTKNSETFPTLVKSLQSLGGQYFNEQIKNQRTVLMGILKEMDLSNANLELGLGVHKLIRQCLRQLELLKNVWQNILSDMVYNKTLCDILNDFCTELIRRIMSMEDISTRVGDELSEIISVILEKAPTLFKDKHQVIHVKTWMKLEQLKMILNASLLEITEQWCEGSGILTANYKADEIKHLIRALFQNTDRRANALASIV